MWKFQYLKYFMIEICSFFRFLLMMAFSMFRTLWGHIFFLSFIFTWPYLSLSLLFLFYSTFNPLLAVSYNLRCPILEVSASLLFLEILGYLISTQTSWRPLYAHPLMDWASLSQIQPMTSSCSDSLFRKYLLTVGGGSLFSGISESSLFPFSSSSASTDPWWVFDSLILSFVSFCNKYCFGHLLSVFLGGGVEEI